MQQIRNAYTNICMVLLTFTACNRAIRYGMDAASQTEPEAAITSTFIHAIPEKPDWFVFLRKAGTTLATHVEQKTLSDEYKLHYAAYKGDATQLAEWIVAHAKWINKTMNGNVTPLHLAVFQGNVECVQLLLDAGADVRTLMDKENAYIQPIHIAAQGDALAVLRALISVQRTAVADCDATGKTALHWAASQGHMRCVQELLEADSNANSEDQEGHTPLCFALEGNHPGVIAQLIKKDANIDCITCMHNDSDRLLRWALAKKAYTCIAAVARKENVSVDLYRKDATGQTLLDCALKTDHPLSIRNLLWRASGENWINYIDENGTPLLHHTILGNHPKLLAELLATSTLNVNAQDAKGKTALQLAAEQGLLSLVQQLLALRGIDVNQKDNEGQTALYAAIAHKKRDISKILMQVPAAAVIKKSTHNQTLLEAAFKANYISFVKKLFDSGEDIHAKNSLNQTLLHRATETGRLEMMEALLKIPEINANAEDIDGNTPLHLAALDGHAVAVEALLKVPGIAVTAKNIDDNTPLHLAASNGHTAAVEALLKVPGIAVNAKNSDGNTPLHLAASNGHAAAVEALLKVPGIAVNAKNSDGNTPLNLADANGHANLTDVHGRPSVAALLLGSKNIGSGSLVEDPRHGGHGGQCQKRKWPYPNSTP